MTETMQRAASEIDNHRRLMTSGGRGRALSAMMLPQVWLAKPAGYGALTTIGRKTRKRRRKCVRVLRRGDQAHLVALRPPHVAVADPGAVATWVHNPRSEPNVHLRIRDGDFYGVAREVTDADERARAQTLLCDTVFGNDYGECLLHLRGLPSRASIQDLRRYWCQTGILFAIDLKEMDS